MKSSASASARVSFFMSIARKLADRGDATVASRTSAATGASALARVADILLTIPSAPTAAKSAKTANAPMCCALSSPAVDSSPLKEKKKTAPAVRVAATHARAAARRGLSDTASANPINPRRICADMNSN